MRGAGPMTVDQAMLDAHRSFSDASLGITEAFHRPVIGGARTIAVLARPLGETSDLGFVVCPSFGPEHTQLGGLDVVVARAVARAGFPVLRFHGSGYADSEAVLDPSVSSHVTDATDAHAFLSSLGVRRVGLIGSLLGGSVATIVAERVDAPAAMLIEPVVDGRRYAERMLRSVVLSGVRSERDEDGRPPLALVREELEHGLGVDLRGFLLTNTAYAELAAIDLSEGRSFAGHVLVVSVSRNGRPSGSLRSLTAALDASGATVSTDDIRDRLVHPLGAFRYVPRPDRPGRIDTQFELFTLVSESAAGCARRVFGDGAIG
jgi:pimeloyl-ACP methyl ester carboxylesterase